MQKFEFQRQPLLGELAMSPEEEEREREEKKMPFIVATTFMPATKGSARTPLGPIMLKYTQGPYK
jgi:hypothetical protein